MQEYVYSVQHKTYGYIRTYVCTCVVEDVLWIIETVKFTRGDVNVCPTHVLSFFWERLTDVDGNEI